MTVIRRPVWFVSVGLMENSGRENTMKKGYGYLLAGSVCIVICICCCIWIVGMTGKESDQKEVSEMEREGSSEDLEVESEIQRFQEDYGLTISAEDMKKQIEIRKEYEALYGHSYNLEEIFLENDQTEGSEDETSEEIWETLDKIDRYKAVYEINESRYLGMTPEKELMALETEYGPLEDKE